MNTEPKCLPVGKVAAPSPPSSFEPPSLSPTAHGVRVSPSCRWRSSASGFFLRKGDRNRKAKGKALRCVSGPGRPGSACGSAACGFCSHRCHRRRWRLPGEGTGAAVPAQPAAAGAFPPSPAALCACSAARPGTHDTQTAVWQHRRQQLRRVSPAPRGTREEKPPQGVCRVPLQFGDRCAGIPCSTSDSTRSSAEPWGWWLRSATCWGQDRDVTDRHGFGFYFPT